MPKRIVEFDIIKSKTSEKLGLLATTLQDEIMLAKLFLEGQRKISLVVPDERSLGYHKSFFNMINTFVDSATEKGLNDLTGMDTRNTDGRTLVDLCRKALLIECGYIEPTITFLETVYKGEAIKIKQISHAAKSISFENMGEKEFTELFQCVFSKIRDIMLESGWEESQIISTFKRS